MLETLLFAMCALEHQRQPEACRAAGQAYFAYVKGDEILESATKRYFKPIERDYIAPLPTEVKSVAIFSWALYNQRFQVKVSRNIRLEAGRFNNSILFNYEF